MRSMFKEVKAHPQAITGHIIRMYKDGILIARSFFYHKIKLEIFRVSRG